MPLAIFVLARLATTVMLAMSGDAQVALVADTPDDVTNYFVYESTPADPGIVAMSSNWDGQWYRLIAERGYSSSSDAVAARARDFPPLYPFTVRATMMVSGLAFSWAAVLTSLLFGAAAMVLIYRLVLPHQGARAAAGVVALTSAFMSAPVLQLAYSESLALFLVCTTLMLLRAGRPWWAIVPLVLLAFTRLISPPMALVALAVVLTRRRAAAPMTRATYVGYGSFALVAVLSVFFWSIIVNAIATTSGPDRVSRMSADTDGWIGTMWGASPLLGIVAAVIPLLFIRIAWSERERWGPELSAWAAGYFVFLWLATPPMSGFIRYLLLAFPLAQAVAGADTRTSRRWWLAMTGSCTALLVLQFLWIRYFFVAEPDSLQWVP